MQKNQKGFTLIELLVVIAIIGILASVVLASLNTARNKGADAAIKADLTNMRAQAELYYDNNGSTYGPATAFSATTAATCLPASPTTTANGLFADTNIKNALTQATAQSGSTTAKCYSGGATQAWAVLVPLKTDSTQAWCVDSNANSKQTLTSGSIAGGLGC